MDQKDLNKWLKAVDQLISGDSMSEWECLRAQLQPLQTHKERVVTEKKELDEKLAKLYAFCFGGNKIFHSLDPQERDRLEDQYTAMKQYSNILGRRVAAFQE